MQGVYTVFFCSIPEAFLAQNHYMVKKLCSFWRGIFHGKVLSSCGKMVY